MLGSGWLTLRQVRAALHNGRLEEAQQLLDQPSARGHRKSWALLADLTRGYVERGERHLRQGNLAGAWDDLTRAEQLAPTDAGARIFREELTRLGFLKLREHLEAGEPQRALEALARLGERAAVHIGKSGARGRGQGLAADDRTRGPRRIQLGHSNVRSSSPGRADRTGDRNVPDDDRGAAEASSTLPCRRCTKRSTNGAGGTCCRWPRRCWRSPRSTPRLERPRAEPGIRKPRKRSMSAREQMWRPTQMTRPWPRPSGSCSGSTVSAAT